jgi:hypothetical protein
MSKTKQMRYIGWMAVNSFSSSISSVISTHSMMNSIMGKVSYSDIILGTYIGKDIIGQFGGLLYSIYTGKNSDKNPEKYIKKGIHLQQCSYYLENLSPFIKDSNFILPFLGFSSILQNISYISIGAVNATNLQKISKQNIGELYSKVASINTLASALGMIVGINIVKFIPSYSIRTICILPILTSINYYSINKSLQIVKDS